MTRSADRLVEALKVLKSELDLIPNQEVRWFLEDSRDALTKRIRDNRMNILVAERFSPLPSFAPDSEFDDKEALINLHTEEAVHMRQLKLLDALLNVLELQQARTVGVEIGNSMRTKADAPSDLKKR